MSGRSQLIASSLAVALSWARAFSSTTLRACGKRLKSIAIWSITRGSVPRDAPVSINWVKRQSSKACWPDNSLALSNITFATNARRPVTTEVLLMIVPRLFALSPIRTSNCGILRGSRFDIVALLRNDRLKSCWRRVHIEGRNAAINRAISYSYHFRKHAGHFQIKLHHSFHCSSTQPRLIGTHALQVLSHVKDVQIEEILPHMTRK